MSTPEWASRGFSRPKFGVSAKNRLWMPKGTSRTIIVLGDVPFAVWEHNLRQGNNYREYWTCIRSIEPRGCPLDEQNKAYFIGFLTCIDTDQWTRKDGTVIKNQRKLIPLRGQMMEFFEKLRAEAGGNLRGAVFDVSRGTFDKCPSIGDRWTYQRTMSEQELASTFGMEEIKEFDYAELLSPKNFDMLAQRAARLGPGGGNYQPQQSGGYHKQNSGGGYQKQGGNAGAIVQHIQKPQGAESDASVDEIPF